MILEGNKNQWLCTVSIDEAGNFTVAWTDERNSTLEYEDYDIYARTFDSEGNPLGPEFRVNDNDNISRQIYPCVTMAPGGGQFLIGWTDFRKDNGDPDFMAQNYINGEPDGDNMLVNTPDWFPYMHQMTSGRSLVSNQNMVAYAWMDNRRHKHWDIYAKLTDWGLVGMEEQETTADYIIFPNPAGKEFKVQSPPAGQASLKFKVSRATLEIFDLNGRKLLEKQIPARPAGGPKGTEEFTVDVSHLNSGLYFCRVRTEKGSVTKKLMIQK